MTKTRQPILVTGSHRSGTTWVGRILAVAPRTYYIHEPFNIGIRTGLIDIPFPNWFQYINDENGHQYRESLHRVISYNYHFAQNVARALTLRNMARTARDQALIFWYRARNYIPIVKDPIAIFSASWLAKAFDMNVLVMIRHPAAFCSSLKIKNWTFDFNNFLHQPLLIEQYLSKFEADIRDYATNQRDIISQAILLWNCIHHTIGIYMEKYPEWRFVRHEDLSIDPLGQFQLIYKSFELEYTRKAKSAILASSGIHNPIEQQAGNEFIRNSKENIYNWKKRLTETEIQRIKENVAPISMQFYDESEW